MKATLEFTLPEEQEEFRMASTATGLSLVIWDLDQWLRGEVKYQELPENVADAYDKVREKLRELSNDHGCPFET